MNKDLTLLRHWLRAERKARGITLVDLAHETGLTQANLSRIERGDTQITLFALIRILYAFGLSYYTLIQHGIIDGPSLAWLESALDSADFEIPTFTLGDVENFVEHHATAHPLFEKWLKYFMTNELGFSPTTTDEMLPDALQLMLLPTPHYTTPATLSGVIYPTRITRDLIRDNYYSGGALILFDLAAYIRTTRLKRGLSRYQLAEAIGRTHTGIRHLETNISSRTLFIDLLNLDNALATNGELLAIAWRVGDLYLGITRIGPKRIAPYTEIEIDLFTRLIVLLRLFQTLPMKRESQHYIDEIRQFAVPHPNKEQLKQATQVNTLWPSQPSPSHGSQPEQHHPSEITNQEQSDALSALFSEAYATVQAEYTDPDEKADILADIAEIEHELRKDDQASISFLRRRLVALKSVAPTVAEKILVALSAPDAPVNIMIKNMAWKVHKR